MEYRFASFITQNPLSSLHQPFSFAAIFLQTNLISGLEGLGNNIERRVCLRKFWSLFEPENIGEKWFWNEQYSIEIWFIEVQTETYLYVKTIRLVQRGWVCCFYYSSRWVRCGQDQMILHATSIDQTWHEFTPTSFHQLQSAWQKVGRYRIYQNSINHQRRQTVRL